MRLRNRGCCITDAQSGYAEDWDKICAAISESHFSLTFDSAKLRELVDSRCWHAIVQMFGLFKIDIPHVGGCNE